jgi:hypothetical protein
MERRKTTAGPSTLLRFAQDDKGPGEVRAFPLLLRKDGAPSEQWRVCSGQKTRNAGILAFPGLRIQTWGTRDCGDCVSGAQFEVHALSLRGVDQGCAGSARWRTLAGSR